MLSQNHLKFLTASVLALLLSSCLKDDNKQAGKDDLNNAQGNCSTSSMSHDDRDDQDDRDDHDDEHHSDGQAIASKDHHEDTDQDDRDHDGANDRDKDDDKHRTKSQASNCVPAGTTSPTPTTTPVPGGTPNVDFTVTADPAGGSTNGVALPVNAAPGNEGLLINGGATSTTDANLQLRFFTLLRNQMKLTANVDCSGGTWEPYLADKMVTSTTTNQIITMSAQYIDWDGRVSQCYPQSILHDNVGPQILFPQYPTTSVTEGLTVRLIYDLSDKGIGTDGGTCQLNGISKPCPAGRNFVDTNALPAGNYTFTITSVDRLNNSSTQSISWTVVSNLQNISQTVDVNNTGKVDILFVIDNSGSMQYEQQSMSRRMGHFISMIHGLDWQIAVTTTDPRDIKLGDGRFIKIDSSGGKYILDPSVGDNAAQSMLGNTLQRREVGSSSEQGIKTVYRAVERSQTAGNPDHQKFFRQGAHFAVVLISDEDESANSLRNNPAQLAKLVSTTFNAQKAFSFHSIITIPGDKACKRSNGDTYGDHYLAMSKMTGGLIGSVCEDDYANQLKGIGQKVQDLVKVISLKCTPIAGSPITVLKDNKPFTSAYTLKGLNMEFNQALQNGKYQVNYQCLK